MLMYNNMERFFVIDKVTKTGQKNSSTSFKNSSVYTGTPEGAARKAHRALCKKKSYRGRCALRVVMKEVEATDSGKNPKMNDGSYVPKKNSENKEKTYMYRFQLKKLNPPVTVTINGQKIEYKYKSVMTKHLNKK